jgi:hypothetical protein
LRLRLFVRGMFACADEKKSLSKSVSVYLTCARLEYLACDSKDLFALRFTSDVTFEGDCIGRRGVRLL